MQGMMGMHGGPMMQGQGCPCMSGGHGSMMQGRAMMGAPAVPSDAAVVDVAGGARLVLTARNPADAPALRSDVRARMAQAQPGTCPML